MAGLKFPNRIKEIREWKKLTQRDIAKSIDRSDSYVWRIENGIVEPGANLLKGIADALACPVDDLYPKKKGGKSKPAARKAK